MLPGSVDGNIRFALNNVSTSGIVSNTDLGVQVAFGKRVGIATINEFDDAALERVVRRAEDLARLAPGNPSNVRRAQARLTDLSNVVLTLDSPLQSEKCCWVGDCPSPRINRGQESFIYTL